MVIVERPAEALAATYRLRWRDDGTWLQEPVSETHVISDQPLDRVHLDAQEIGRCEAFPGSFEKRRPSGLPVSLWGGLDAVFSEDVGDGVSSHLMAQIGQRAADSRVSPRGIFMPYAE